MKTTVSYRKFEKTIWIEKCWRKI